jgi:hypothetical protein
MSWRIWWAGGATFKDFRVTLDDPVAAEQFQATEELHGGIGAETRRLTIGTRDGGTRALVLRTFVNVAHAED